jgi:hypothetical protein
MLVTPHTRFVGDNLHGRSPVLRPAWVNLDMLYPRDRRTPLSLRAEGLDVSGSVPGFVTGWFAWNSDQWLAVANFSVGYADGRSQRVFVTDQLISGTAVRPRDNKKP